MADVKKWLDNIHLPQYYSLLINAGYTSLRVCSTLTESDLFRLSINLPGHQKRILAHLPSIENDLDVEYDNIEHFNSIQYKAPRDNTDVFKSPIVVTEQPPSKQNCKPPKQIGYFDMDRSSYRISNTAIKTTEVDDDDEQIYDVPPLRISLDKTPDAEGCRLSQLSTAASDCEYVSADSQQPPPILPPKKRLSNADLNTRLGITPSVEYANTNKTGPPLMTVIPKEKTLEKESVDMENNVAKQKPIPKPRGSLVHKKPTPMPRVKKQFRLSQSLKEGVESVQDLPVLKDVATVNSKAIPVAETCEKTDELVYEVVNDEEDVFQEVDKSQVYEDCDEPINNLLKSNLDAISIPISDEIKNGEKQEQKVLENVYEDEISMKTGNYSMNTFEDPLKYPDLEEPVYELDTHLPSLPIKKQSSNHEDDSDYSEPDVPFPPKGLERIVIGSDDVIDISKEESDNMANEMIYQDCHSLNLTVDDYKKSRESYAGVWEMRSGINKGVVLPVNEVKPMVRLGTERNTDGALHTFNIPPPTHTPPPLPASYDLLGLTSDNDDNFELLSPTLKSLPVAPAAPLHATSSGKENVSPPSVPPRSLKSYDQQSSLKKEVISPQKKVQVANEPDRSSVLSFSQFAEERTSLGKNNLEHVKHESLDRHQSSNAENLYDTADQDTQDNSLEYSQAVIDNPITVPKAYPFPGVNSSVEDQYSKVSKKGPTPSQAVIANPITVPKAYPFPGSNSSVEDQYSRVSKKGPAPPPKVANPFKDFYNAQRGTYCFEAEIQPQNSEYNTASGWESEDTLSDGGDFFSDEEDAEKLSTLSRGTLNKEGSIPIVAVTKSRILERSGFLNKKSSGRSAGNPIKASLRWQKRWVLFDSISFRYFSNNKSPISKRIIPASSIINVEQDIRLGEAHPFRFTVFTIDRAYTFGAEDLDDLSLWTNLIMSAILESSTDEFMEGGEMHNPSMKGFVKMEGAKGKRYLAVKGDKFSYYNTYSDFQVACPIHSVEMKLASVKDAGKNKLQLYTPYASYVFNFDSNEDCLNWKEAFEEAIANGLGDNSVLSDVYENHSNRFCADCGCPDPHWASINIGITLCKKCAGIHRFISIPITKVRSLRMDFKVWTPVLKEMFKKIGNDNANNFWEWHTTEDSRIDSDVDMNVRKDYIIAKYKHKRYVKYHPLRCDNEALNEALCKSVQYEDVVETMQLLFSGADILYSSATYSSNDETPLQISKRANQPVQMEFLFQNGAEGSGQLPLVSSPISPSVGSSATADLQILPSRRAITLKGYLHKTGSNVKGEFLKRWVILEHDILSYYENENKSQAKDSIQRQEMLSVTRTFDDRYEHSFVLATTKPHGRTYLFAAETEEVRSNWVNSLARTIAPIPVEKLEDISKFTRGGVVFVRDGSTGKYRQTWIQVEGRKLVFYDQEKQEFEDVDLRKIKNITLLQSSQRCSLAIDSGNPFVMDLTERALYIQADIRKETEEWFNFIKKSSESGGTLSDQQLTSDNVPVIVDKCISHVETHGGLEVEGIYRLNGQHSKVSNLLLSFQKDARSVHILQEEYIIHDVATALKRFIRGLEDPLLTRDLYQKWIRTASMSDIDFKLQQYKHLLEDLPRVNYNTLEKLVRHLVKVKEKESLNKMGVINIASIFGPILLNTSQDSDSANQGFGSTNKEIAVLKDILENHTHFYVVNTIQRNREELFLQAIKKMQDAEKTSLPDNDMIIPIHVRNKDDPDVVTHKISPEMTVQEVLSYVLKKRNLKQSDNWGLYEIICNEELERPLHYQEKVLSVTMKWTNWPDEFRVENHLCLKKNYVYQQIESVYDAHFSLFGELKFSERKGFKKFCFEFSQYKLSYQKDPKSLVHLASWNVEDLTIFVGSQHKRNPPTKWAFTFVKIEDEMTKYPGGKDSPFFGHSVCCNNQEELYRWIAAMYRAQHPQGLLPRSGSSGEEAACWRNPSQIELDTVVPSGLNTSRSMSNIAALQPSKKDKHKSSIFQKLRKQNR